METDDVMVQEAAHWAMQHINKMSNSMFMQGLLKISDPTKQVRSCACSASLGCLSFFFFFTVNMIKVSKHKYLGVGYGDYFLRLSVKLESKKQFSASLADCHHHEDDSDPRPIGPRLNLLLGENQRRGGGKDLGPPWFAGSDSCTVTLAELSLLPASKIFKTVELQDL